MKQMIIMCRKEIKTDLLTLVVSKVLPYIGGLWRHLEPLYIDGQNEDCPVHCRSMGRIHSLLWVITYLGQEERLQWCQAFGPSTFEAHQTRGQSTTAQGTPTNFWRKPGVPWNTEEKGRCSVITVSHMRWYKKECECSPSTGTVPKSIAMLYTTTTFIHCLLKVLEDTMGSTH